MTAPSLSAIRLVLQRHQPRLATAAEFPRHRRAAVTLLLRDGHEGAEILYILRSDHPDDPWSGDIAFPGGHLEEHDPTARHAAERETFEETGLDLEQAEYLGQLDDIAGAHLPIIVSCFVYLLSAPAPVRNNGELTASFWLPLHTVSAPQRQIVTRVVFGGETLQRPAIDLLGPGHPPLWGITYRLTTQFLRLLDHHLPDTPLP